MHVADGEGQRDALLRVQRERGRGSVVLVAKP